MPKILAICDINDNLISLKAIINEAFPGVVLLTTLNGAKGIELAIANNPDVILLDIIMPGMDGFEVCRQLKQDERVSDIPVVFLTALKGDKENRIKALEVGAEGFLSKPIDQTELTAQIRAMVKIKAASEQKRDEKERLKKMVEERTIALQDELNERIKTEEELRKSEERFRHISSGISDISYSCINDLKGNGTINWLYGAAEKITGYTIDEIIEMECWGKLVIDEDFQIFKKCILGALPGKSEMCQLRLKKKDHSIVWVQATAECVKGPDGAGFNIVYGRLVDITGRKNAEELLRESEEKYRLMVELLPDAVIIHEGGKFVFANAAALKTVGADSFDQLIERPLIDYVHPDFMTISMSRIKEIYSTGQPSRFSEEKFITLKGEIIDVEVIGIPVLYRGRPAIQTIIRNITERKQAEELLRESEYFFKESQRAAFVGSYKFDLKNDSWSSSEVLEQIFGIEESYTRSLEGWLDIAHPDDREMMSTYFIEEVVAKRNAFNKEYRIIRKSDGETRWVLGLGKLSFDAEDNITEMIGTIQDITERKNDEDALLRNNTRLELALKAANMAWWEMDLPTGNVIFEKRKAEMLDFPPEKFKRYTDFSALVHPDDQERTIDAMRAHLSGSVDKYEVEYRIKSASEEYRWFYDIGSVTKRDSQGKPLTVAGLVLNISERKEAEELLKTSNEFNEYLMQTIPFGMDIVDEYGNILFQNQNFENVFGKKVIGGKCWELYRDDKTQCLDCPLTKGLEIGKTEVYESSGVLGERVFEISHTGMIFKGKKAMLEIFQDITERKRVEEALWEREQLFRGLFNASPDAIVLIDPNHPSCLWPIVDCNEASCRMNGYTREEMIGQSIDLLNITPEKREDRTAYYNELREKGIIHMETSHRHKDGHIFPIEISTSIIVIGGREMVLGIDRDITERKQAEMALKESEDRYRSFISQVSEGVYRFECDQPIDISLPIEEQADFIYDHMFIAECNDAFLKIYGIKDRSDLIGKSHLYFHGGRNNPVNRGALVAFIKNGYHIENATTEELNHHGQMTYISHNSLGIIDNNQLVRIWGTQIDITEKIRADRVQQVLYTISNATFTSNDLPELIEIISNELARLLDSTNFFIAFYDESTKMLSTVFEKGDRDKIDTWSAEKSLTGYVIKHQKSLLANEAEINKLCESGEIEIVGIPSKIWMGVPLSVNKKVIGAIVVQSYDNPDAFTEKEKLMLEFVSHQISTSIERKKIEQELKLMGKAFDQSPITIVITDKNGNIEYTNPKFTETTGYTTEEVKGKNPRVLQSGSQSKAYYQELWETILTGNDWVGEFQNKRKNGELYWESAVISPITNESGDIVSFMAIKEEITEKKKMISDLIQARNKAEESDRLKSAFLANMSHEIRTPLNSIIGFSELMADPDFDAAQQTEFAQIIINSGNSLLTIISDIMDFSKIEAGQVIVNKFPFVTQNLISGLLREYSIVAQGKGIELRIDPLNPKEDLWINSDESRLKQVLVNLVGNAIKFTKEGYVELGIEATRDFIQFRVSDTGIGIPEKYHDKIFERFRQVESSNSRKYGGNGLGLAISKSLVEMMGGEIWIESVQAKGSTFYFTIPIGTITT